MEKKTERSNLWEDTFNLALCPERTFHYGREGMAAGVGEPRTEGFIAAALIWYQIRTESQGQSRASLKPSKAFLQ